MYNMTGTLSGMDEADTATFGIILMEAMNRLREDEKTAVIMKNQGYSYQEIGEALGISKTHARRQYCMGLLRLRAMSAVRDLVELSPILDDEDEMIYDDELIKALIKDEIRGNDEA